MTRAAERVLSWLEDPSEEHGLNIATRGGWEFSSFAALATQARAVAAGLQERGIERNDVVSLALPAGREFMTVFYGVLLTGAVASPLPPRSALASVRDNGEQIEASLRSAASSLLVVDQVEPYAQTLHDCGVSVPVIALDKLLSDPAAARVRRPGELAILQFTSGASARPKGVRLGWDQLRANFDAIIRWLRWTGNDVWVTWIPLHHDMGLISLLADFDVGSSAFLMTPQQFVRDPLRWLGCFGRDGGTGAATPCFGLTYILRRVKPAQLEGLDFSRWKAIVIGAERVDPSVVQRFVRLLSPFGFRPETLSPAYGLAEATLAVSGTPLRERPIVASIGKTTLAVGKAVTVRSTQSLGGVEGVDIQGVVSCGAALPGTEIAIVDDDGRELPPETVGEICVRGRGVADGYNDEQSDTGTRFVNGTLLTADIGFIHAGRLFVIGRAGDSIKVRGRIVFAEDVELVASRVPGVPERRIALLLGTHEGQPTAVVVAESRDTTWLPALKRAIRLEIGAAIDVIVVTGSAGLISRTTSGKPRRRAMWQRLAEARLSPDKASDARGN